MLAEFVRGSSRKSLRAFAAVLALVVMLQAPPAVAAPAGAPVPGITQSMPAGAYRDAQLNRRPPQPAAFGAGPVRRLGLNIRFDARPARDRINMALLLLAFVLGLAVLSVFWRHLQNAYASPPQRRSERRGRRNRPAQRERRKGA
jgi:hypothetical protein